MFSQGQFINSAATPPEELARKRAEIAAMMPRFGNARYVGEGLGQLFMGIGLGRQQKALDGQEREGRAAAQGRFDAVMGGGIRGTAQPGGFSVLGTMPMDPVAAPDPSSPEGIASDTMAVLGRASYTPGDKDSFVAAMMPHALRVSRETGLDPRLVIAQAAQETGWGKSAPNNNFFGIKSHGKGGGGTFATTEFVNGQPVTINDSFRGYGSMGESAADYARFLRENPRYSEMLAAPDLQSQIAALGASGYATDPNYAASVSAIANSIQVPGMTAAPGMNSPQMAAATIPTTDLMALVNDPWITPEQRATAQAMLDQQMKMNDPAYTMGLRADELAIQKAEAELEAMRNPTQKPLEVGGVLLDPVTFQPIFDSRQGGAADLPADFQSLKLRAEAAGLQPGTPEYQSFMMQGANGGAPAAFVALDMQAQAAGFEPGTPEYKEFMATRGAGLQAQAKVEGEAAGEAVTGLGGAVAKAQRAIDLIDEIAKDPALPSITGMLQGMLPPALTGGQSGVDLNAKILQLQGTAFLEAFESLKGGGAITEIEGTKAEQAIARLQRAQSTEAYQAALSDLRGVIESGMNRAKEKAAKAGGEGGTSTGGKTRLRFNPETGGLEAVQ